MIYLTTLLPLMENSEQIYTKINYDKRFTGMNDITPSQYQKKFL